MSVRLRWLKIETDRVFIDTYFVVKHDFRLFALIVIIGARRRPRSEI